MNIGYGYTMVRVTPIYGEKIAGGAVCCVWANGGDSDRALFAYLHSDSAVVLQVSPTSSMLNLFSRPPPLLLSSYTHTHTHSAF